MAHFKVGVIVPPVAITNRIYLEQLIHARMAPFDDNLVVATFSFNGESCSFYNPKGRWDSYEVGGRWNGWLTDADADSAKFRDNVAPVEQVIEDEKWPTAFITPDGLWLESSYGGELIVLRNFPDHYVVLLDAHI